MDKRTFDKFLTFTLGFITPWPIFIDLKTLSPVFLIYDNFISHPNIEGDIPVPIGLFSATIFFIFTGIKSKNIINDIKVPLALFILFNIVFYKYSFLRILSILFPFISLLGVSVAIKKRKEFVGNYSKGFIFGFILFLFINLLSFFFFNAVDIFNNNMNKESIINLVGPIDLNYARQIFGLEIYQYYISVASVLSLLFGTTYFLIFKNNGEQINQFRALFFIMSASAMLSIFTLRKASFVDFIVISLISFFYVLIKKKVSIKQYIMTAISFVILIISNYVISSARTMDFELIAQERNYLHYLSTLPIENLSQILFGYASSFGGFSNIFIELFASGGILGLTIYVVFFIIIFSNILKLIYSNNKDMGLLLVFISCNLLIGNFVNINLSQPYYVCNLSSIIVVLSSLRQRK